ncbi:bacterial transcriptional activator domain-containing protein [Streptomyces sp. NBC_00989]|uniref:bacterial transcriptional activator domain-containing protein n=1 Tax=Streptomyces sp. NBC_00989 TaxID=2903705 RepID=UPI00386BBE82|nr:bacterial transcriptional activator domain-containing protein [Streptomyces sp. NBC_00989]
MATGIPLEARDHLVFTALEREYLTAVKEAADAALAGGGTDRLLTVLHRTTCEHPLDEQLQARLVRALAATGQRAEALDVWQRVRVRLDAELGVPPGAELRAAQTEVLRDTTSVLAPPGGAAAPSSTARTSSRPGDRIPRGPRRDVRPPDRSVPETCPGGHRLGYPDNGVMRTGRRAGRDRRRPAGQVRARHATEARSGAASPRSAEGPRTAGGSVPTRTSDRRVSRRPAGPSYRASRPHRRASRQPRTTPRPPPCFSYRTRPGTGAPGPPPPTRVRPNCPPISVRSPVGGPNSPRSSICWRTRLPSPGSP